MVIAECIHLQGSLGVGASWSGCSRSLNKKPSLPHLNAPTYGSLNFSSNRVTGWDNEGAPMYILEAYIISEAKG